MDSKPPPDKPQNVYLLARQSMAQDDSHGTENQLDDLYEFCEDEGIGVGPEETHVIIEPATSGWKEKEIRDANGRPTGEFRTERPGLRRIEDGLKTREGDGLIVVRCDRGMRNHADLITLVNIVQSSCPGKYDPPTIYCWSIDGSFDLRTAQGIDNTFANAEAARRLSAITSRNVAKSHNRRANRGVYRGGGGQRYGYEICEPCEECNYSRLRLVPSQAAVIQAAAQGIVDGKTWNQVYEELGSMPGFTEYRGRGRDKRPPIKGSLLSPTTAGLSVYHGEIVGKGKWEPVLDIEPWKQVGAVLRDPRRAYNIKGGRKVRQLGSGLFCCPMPGCDGRMGYSVRRDDSQSEAQYSCALCGRFQRPVSMVDRIVNDAIPERLAKPDAIKLIKHRAIDHGPEIAGLRNEVARLEQRIAVLRDQFLDDDDIDEDQIREWMAIANRELRARRARIAGLVSREKVSGDPEGIFSNPDAPAIWAGLTDDRKRAIIRQTAIIWVGPTSRRGRPAIGAPEDTSNILISFLGTNGSVPGKPRLQLPASSSIEEIERVRAVMAKMFAERDSYPVQEVLAEIATDINHKIIQRIRRELGLVAVQESVWVWRWPIEAASVRPRTRKTASTGRQER